jgi:hypothetical protein
LTAPGAPPLQSSAEPARGAVQERRDALALGILAFVTLLFHLLAIWNYGYFRDEFYYIACSKWLALGYVDHPPLSILILAIQRKLFGDSLLSIRILPAICDAAVVFMTGWIAREMGGRRFAQMLAALAAMTAPVYLGVTGFYSMNAFELAFWAIDIWIVVRILRTGDQKLWLAFGVIAGIGVENKHSMLFFCFAVLAGLILTEQRRHLLSPWLWIGGAAGALLLAPNIVWEIRSGWPTLEFVRNAQLVKNYHASLLEFAAGQVLLMGPTNLPVWLAGLGFCLFSGSGKTYRALGWAYLAMFALMAVAGGKAYYMTPIYPALLAPGALVIERAAASFEWRWLRPALACLVMVGGIAVAPMALPILPPKTFLQYARMVGVAEVRQERHQQGAMPQQFADMFNWPEMAATVAGVYRSLPPDERADCTIFAGNYGEAGALEFFGPRYGLPRVISPHNNYWIWGPGDGTTRTVIFLGARLAEIAPYFDQVTEEGVVRCDYCMPFENELPVWVATGPKFSFKAVWPRLKHFE